MSDTPETNASPPDPARETQTITSTDVGNAGAVLGLGGVAAAATAGEVSPQAGAVPAADQPAQGPSDPAAAAAPAASTQEPTGQAPASAAATVATPGATDGRDGGSDLDIDPTAPAPLVRFAPGTAAYRDMTSNLNAIEQLALFWGGETGIKIRNHIGRIRELLQ